MDRLNVILTVLDIILPDDTSPMVVTLWSLIAFVVHIETTSNNTMDGVVVIHRLDAILEQHQTSKDANSSHLATIMVVPMVSPYGLVDINASNQVVGFREKVEMPHWINAGVYVLERRIYSELPEIGDHENDTFPRLASSGQISAYRSREFWRSVDSFKDLREAEEYLTRR